MELDSAGARFSDLPGAVAEPKQTGAARWRDLDGGGNSLRSMEDAGIPEAALIRSARGVDAREKRAIAIRQGFTG